MFQNEKNQFLDPIFIDSGAYSVVTGAFESIPVEDYSKWVIKYQNNFRLIAVPDVIGNPKETEINTLKFAENVKGLVPANKLVPIYHLRSKKIDEFKRMLEYADEIGSEWVAIGATLGNQIKKSQQLIALEQVFRYLPRKRFKIHLLGATDLETVLTFRPNSVDSSKLILYSRNLQIIEFNTAITSGLKVSQSCGKLQEKEQIKLCLETAMRGFKGLGIEVNKEELEEDLYKSKEVSRFLFVNAIAIKLLEEYARKMCQDFLFITTYPGTGAEGIPEKFLREFLCPRALMSYAEFHGMNDIRIEKSFSIIRKDNNE